MKLSETIKNALNNQISHERKNQAIYLQIASYFEDMQLTNISKFFFEQANGENNHAQWLIDHLNNRTGGKVTLQPIEAPNLEINSIKDIANIYVAVEESTTANLETIYQMILDEKSYIDISFMNKMLEEQVEEEDLANKFALQVQLCNDLVLYNNTFSL